VLEFNSLPEGDYQLFLYGHGGAEDQNVYFELFDYYYDPLGSSNTANSTNWASSTWEVGLQYVRFDDIEIDTNGYLKVEAFYGDSEYSVINGLQLLSFTNGTTSSSSHLSYPESQTNGVRNLVATRGTVSFWAKPDWVSGTGSGVESRLLELGDDSGSATNGWWALYCSTNGNELKFGGRGGGGTNETFQTCSINWNSSNSWQFVTLTYSATNSAIYLNGQLAGSSTNGVSLTGPSTELTSDGLNIGSASDGTRSFDGTLDEVEIYNYPFTATEVLNRFNAIMAADNDGDGIPNGSDTNPTSASDGWLIFSIDNPVNGEVIK